MIERGILYIVDASSVKVRNHLLTLLKYLNRARYTPYLAISDDTHIADHLKTLKIAYTVLPDMMAVNKLNVGAVAKQIAEFAGDKTINLVHSHDFQACFVAASVAKMLGVPHVSTIHSSHDFSIKKKGLLNTSNEKIASMPNRLIAVSDEIRGKLESFNEVKVIYNGVEAERFAETTDTEHLYHELGLEKDNNIIGTIANLEEHEGVGVLLDAAKLLIERNPLNHFAIVGDGEQMDSYKAKVVELEIGKNVHFLGYRRDIAHILKSLNVVVIPSLVAGLPMVLLEALASQKPVVATDVPGIREAVGEDCVTFIEPSNEKAMADAVGEILDDAMRATTMANAGLKAMTEKFTIDHMLKPTQSLYLEIAG